MPVNMISKTVAGCPDKLDTNAYLEDNMEPVIHCLRFKIGPMSLLCIWLDERPAIRENAAPISKADWLDIEPGDVIRVGKEYRDVIEVHVYRSHPCEDENRPVKSGRDWMREVTRDGFENR